MSALDSAVAALIKATKADAAEVKFVRIDVRRGQVQVVTRKGVQRLDIAKPKTRPSEKVVLKPAKRPAKKAAPAKKTAAKRPAKKTTAKKAAKK